MDDPLPSQLILQFVLILLNAFFACAEIAIISFNDTRLKLAADSGNKNAQYLVLLTKQPARFLATIQVGITLAGFLASAFAADNFSDRLVAILVSWGVTIPVTTLNTISVIFITVVLSYFTLVLGELVPKRIAMQKAEPLAMAFGRVIYFISKATAPLVWLLTISTNGLLRLFGMSVNAEESNVSEEEIRVLVDLGEEKGTIAPEEGEMIDNILEFSGKSAAELMTHRTDLTVLWLEDSPDVWEQIIYASNYSRYPVCRNDMDDIVGILHVRDFFCNLRNAQHRDIKTLLRPAYFIPETVSADVLLREMKKNRTHMAVVVDEYGGTSGILTMEDLLEEIVGQIEDEHDEGDEPDIIGLENNSWRVRGSVEIERLADELCVAFPEGDYDTLGGLIFSQMSSIPEDGSHPEVEVAGVRMRVDQLEDRRIEWAILSLVDQSECGQTTKE